MAGGLRYETGREMPPGMQALAANKFIEIEAGVMLQVLKEVDMDCQFCCHASFEVPCAEETPMVFCDKCKYTCPCSGCRDNSKYEWCGAEEARRRLAKMRGGTNEEEEICEAPHGRGI